MEISYNELKSKEIINLCDGRKLGHIIDILFGGNDGKVLGIVVPGERRLFRRNDDIFVPLEKIKKIGDDVVLIRYENLLPSTPVKYNYEDKNSQKVYMQNRFTNESQNQSFVRYRRLDNKKYK